MQVVETLYQHTSEEVLHKINELIQHYNIDTSKLLFVLGENGIEAEQEIYNIVKNEHHSINTAIYKDLCGEYYTSSAFAFWLGAQILSKQHIPKVVSASDKTMNDINHILIFNIFDQKEISLILLKNADLQ